MRASFVIAIAAATSSGCGGCGEGAAPRPSATGSSRSTASATATATPSATATATAAASAAPDAPLEVALSEVDADAIVKRGEVKVMLVDAGSGDKKPLRYEPRPAATKLRALIEVAVVDAAGGPSGGMSAPAMELDLAVTFARPLVLKVEKVGAKPAGAAEELLAEETKPLFDLIAGKSERFKTDARALELTPELPKPFAIPRPGEAVPEHVVAVHQLWSTVEESVRDLVAPLPDEPLGDGARWTASWRLRRGGVAFLRRAEYTLRLTPEASLGVRYHERAVASSERDPLVPEGVTVRALGGGGEGRGTIGLGAGLAPHDADFTLDSRIAAEIAGPDPKAAAAHPTLVVHQRVTISRAEAKAK